MQKFLLGGNGWFMFLLTGGFLCLQGEVFMLRLAEPPLCQHLLNCVTMASEGIMLFVLDGDHSNPVTRRLQQESPFGMIFGAYINVGLLRQIMCEQSVNSTGTIHSK